MEELPPSLVVFSTDPLCLIGLFLALSVFTHYYILRASEIPESVPKYLDYVWVVLAALTILAAPFDVRKAWYEDQIVINGSYVDGAYERYARFVSRKLDSDLCNTNTSRVNKTYDQEKFKFCMLLTSIKKNLGLYIDEKQPVFPNRQVLKVLSIEPAVYFELEELKKTDKEYVDSLKRLINSKYQMRAKFREKMMIYFSPIIFIFALVVRVSKTSIELKIMRKKRKSSTQTK
jgi:hypothetical protein